MKKIGLILCTVMFSLGIMAGCEKQESPTDVVNTYFSSIKKSSTQEAKKLVESTIPAEAISQDTGEITGASDSKTSKSEDKKLDESLKMYLSKIDAKVLSEKVEDDKATVKVSLKAPNYSDLLLKVMEESIASTFSGKDVSEADVEKSLEEKIKASEVETRTGEITLTKKDNSWQIKSDDAMTNLLLGEADETESVMYSK